MNNLTLLEDIVAGKLLKVRTRKDEKPVDTARRIAYKLRANGLPDTVIEGYSRDILLPAYSLSTDDLSRVVGKRQRYDVDALKKTRLDGWLDMAQAKQIKRGREWHLPCPKCGGDDRFALIRTPDGDRCFCRQCTGADTRWMDPIGFVQWLHGVDFKAACERLGGILVENYPVSRKTANSAKSGALEAVLSDFERQEVLQCLDDEIKRAVKALSRESVDKAFLFRYLARRGISESVAIAALLGWHTGGALQAPAGIVIPCFDNPYEPGRRLRYCKVRRMDGEYRHVKGGKAYPFTLQGGIAEDARPILLVENELDALSLESAYRGNATMSKGVDIPVQIIAIGGAGLCRKIELPTRRRYDAFDNDEAGMDASAYWQSKRLMDGYAVNDPGDLTTAQRRELLERLT